MKKIIYLFAFLGTMTIYGAMAQSATSAHERMNLQLSCHAKPAAFDIPDPFAQPPHLPKAQKPKADGERWEPDTVYSFCVSCGHSAYKWIHTYNSQGAVLTQVVQTWQNNTWKNDRQYIYTYDANNNMLTQLSETWQNNDWENTFLMTYTYDDNNNMLTQLSQTRENNDWQNFLQYTHTYDANNNMLTRLSQIWENNDWKNSVQYLYTYDVNNNILIELYKSWQNNNWENFSQHTYTYDANNNRLTLLMQRLNDSSQYIYTYDANNNMLTHLDKKWQNNDWQNNGQYIYTYDANNNILTELGQLWQSNNNVWRNREQIVYTYDANNNLLIFLLQMWENNDWVNNSQYTYTYDANDNGTLSEAKKWISGNWQNYDGVGLYYNNMQSSFNCGGYKATATYMLILGGNSLIGGYVGYESDGKTISQKSVDFPAENVTVHLDRQKNGVWSTIARTHTNTEGYFEFRDVPAGRYRVVLDIPNLTHDNPLIIDVNENDTIQNITYGITDDGSIINTGIVVEMLHTTSLRVYPNPTTGQLRIDN